MYVRVAHVLLVVGLMLQALALSLPWGMSRHGLPLYLGDFSSPRLAREGEPVAGWAGDAASRMVLWAFGFAAAMIAANVAAVAMNGSALRAKLSGCLTSLFTVIVFVGGLLLLLDLALMVGFGALALLTQLPGLYHAGLTNTAARGAAAGFWLWWVGIALGCAGAIGELGMRRQIE